MILAVQTNVNASADNFNMHISRDGVHCLGYHVARAVDGR